MSKIGKANMKIFLNKTERILLNYQFQRTLDSDKFRSYEWVKQTKNFGKVYFRPDNDSDSSIYSVFGMFEQPELTKDFECNHNSGKYNLHIPAVMGVTEAVASFERMVMLIATLDARDK